MTVIQALTQSVDAVRRNPLLIGLSVAFALLQVPAVVAPQLAPLVSVLLSLGASAVAVVVAPLVMGGMIALGAESLDGDARFGTFLQRAREHFLRLFVAYLLVVVVLSMIGIVGSLVGGVLALLVGVSAASAGLSTNATIFGTLLFAVGFSLLTVVPGFFVQFFGHAVVLDDKSVTESLTRSASLVWQNLSTVFGYFLVVSSVGVIAGVVGAVGSLVGSAPAVAALGLPELSTPVVVAAQVAGILVVGALSSLFWPFSVAVYTQIRDRTVDDDGPTADATLA